MAMPCLDYLWNENNKRWINPQPYTWREIDFKYEVYFYVELMKMEKIALFLKLLQMERGLWHNNNYNFKHIPMRILIKNTSSSDNFGSISVNKQFLISDLLELEKKSRIKPNWSITVQTIPPGRIKYFC